MQEYNHKHIQTVCPECKNHDILQDPVHHHTYCTKCGLILEDKTIIFHITEYLQNQRRKELIVRDLHKRKRKLR